MTCACRELQGSNERSSPERHEPSWSRCSHCQTKGPRPCKLTQLWLWGEISSGSLGWDRAMRCAGLDVLLLNKGPQASNWLWCKIGGVGLAEGTIKVLIRLLHGLHCFLCLTHPCWRRSLVFFGHQVTVVSQLIYCKPTDAYGVHVCLPSCWHQKTDAYGVLVCLPSCRHLETEGCRAQHHVQRANVRSR